jgi:DNA-binding HxlR family transcriptional regulator
MEENGVIHRERDRCPLYTAICAIQGRWKPMIFRRLGDNSLGFGELRRTMPGITIKVLRQQLRELEADDLVARSVPEKQGLKVKYRITSHGQTLRPVLETLWAWGTLHLAHTEKQAAEVALDPESGRYSRVRKGQDPSLEQNSCLVAKC